MYPPPPPDYVQRLIGLETLVLAFGQYNLHIGFDGPVELNLFCSFRFAAEKALADAPIREFPLTESDMLRVLGVAVEHAECEPDATLHLKFANGDRLVAYAIEPGYEAYTLTVDGDVYVA